jgi:hypothetical protein
MDTDTTPTGFELDPVAVLAFSMFPSTVLKINFLFLSIKII